MESTAGTPVPPQKHVSPVWIAVAVVVALAGAGYWYYANMAKPAAPSLEGDSVQPAASAPVENADLGSSLYVQSSNPVDDTLPETVAPVANPIEDAYQNPFE